mmetsp:Transcript_23670/g.41934  ORF Transcript_23670/g.41934 Transcript_23670/m.41934 type:complete len:169 (+) Transcript_23670:797-1303(+)
MAGAGCRALVDCAGSRWHYEKIALGNRLKQLLGIRRSRIEKLVECFYEDLKDNNNELPEFGPGPKFREAYLKFYQLWKNEWQERIRKVEQIVGPDVYWKSDYNIFKSIDENDPNFCRINIQKDEDSHWGSLHVSYNPFVAVWESLRPKNESSVIKIFDTRERLVPSIE